MIWNVQFYFEELLRIKIARINIEAVQAIRKLKRIYPAHLGYLKEEGANHGFIHPTPWDNQAVSYETNKTISIYQLGLDILPRHSTPLIIHHASGLADWIRQIEVKENIEFQRAGTTIGWWQTYPSAQLCQV